MPAGNGFMFRARSERDAKAFVRELQQRRPTPSRRRSIVVGVVTVLVLTAWLWWGYVG